MPLNRIFVSLRFWKLRFWPRSTPRITSGTWTSSWTWSDWPVTMSPKKFGTGSFRSSLTERMSKDMPLKPFSRLVNKNSHFYWICSVLTLFVVEKSDFVTNILKQFKYVISILDKPMIMKRRLQGVIFSQALQAPACHENMVKVGGYILGEFGNLIAGDQRSSPLVQFRLLHSKYHLCSLGTRALLLTTYIKFVNLFPEIKTHIQVIND